MCNACVFTFSILLDKKVGLPSINVDIDNINKITIAYIEYILGFFFFSHVAHEFIIIIVCFIRKYLKIELHEQRLITMF